MSSMGAHSKILLLFEMLQSGIMSGRGIDKSFSMFRKALIKLFLGF
ncbi:MAG TPA: hypothetical protein VJ888_05945 [Mobilitalea sp.]|nr:hypothetical protein [Mobilitalea sp.]